MTWASSGWRGVELMQRDGYDIETTTLFEREAAEGAASR
jgi:hypothetical protein